MVSILSVVLANRPGSLAEFLEALADRKVNVEAVSAEAQGDFGAVRLIVDDAEVGRSVAQDLGHPARVAEAIQLDVPNRPGELARTMRRLSDAGINLVSVFGTTAPEGSGGRLVVRTADVKAARKALGVDS